MIHDRKWVYQPLLQKCLQWTAVGTLILSALSVAYARNASADEGLNTGFTDDYWQKVKRAKGVPDRDSGGLVDRTPTVPPRGLDDPNAPSTKPPAANTDTAERVNEIRANQIARDIANQNKGRRIPPRSRNRGAGADSVQNVASMCPAGFHYVRGDINDPCGKPFFGCYVDSGQQWGICTQGRRWTSLPEGGCGCAPITGAVATPVGIPVADSSNPPSAQPASGRPVAVAVGTPVAHPTSGSGTVVAQPAGGSGTVVAQPVGTTAQPGVATATPASTGTGTTVVVPATAASTSRARIYEDAKAELASKGASCRNWDLNTRQSYCNLALRDPNSWSCPSGYSQTEPESPYCLGRPQELPSGWRSAKGCGEFRHAGIPCNQLGLSHDVPFDGLERISRAEVEIQSKGPYCRNTDVGQQQAYCNLAIRDRHTWRCPSNYSATQNDSAYCMNNPGSLPQNWERAKGCGEFRDYSGLDCNKVGFRFWEDVAARDAREASRVAVRDKMCWAQHVFNFRTCWIKPMVNGSCASGYTPVASMGKCVKWANQNPGLDNCHDRFGIAINEACLNAPGSPGGE